jgi:hypothetical protein
MVTCRDASLMSRAHHQHLKCLPARTSLSIDNAKLAGVLRESTKQCCCHSLSVAGGEEAKSRGTNGSTMGEKAASSQICSGGRFSGWRWAGMAWLLSFVPGHRASKNTINHKMTENMTGMGVRFAKSIYTFDQRTGLWFHKPVELGEGAGFSHIFMYNIAESWLFP